MGVNTSLSKPCPSVSLGFCCLEVILHGARSFTYVVLKCDLNTIAILTAIAGLIDKSRKLSTYTICQLQGMFPSSSQ